MKSNTIRTKTTAINKYSFYFLEYFSQFAIVQRQITETLVLHVSSQGSHTFIDPADNDGKLEREGGATQYSPALW